MCQQTLAELLLCAGHSAGMHTSSQEFLARGVSLYTKLYLEASASTDVRITALCKIQDISNSHHMPLTFILQIRKLTPRESRWVAQGHPSSKLQS